MNNKEEIKPFNEGYLDVGDKHKIWFGEYGKPKGIPVVSFHGGPGSRSKSKHLGIFNLEKLRVIQFDQRGCGKSRPGGRIVANTTQDLIEDTEKIREHLKINEWVLSGASWGATLALLYAEAFPGVCRALILSEIPLGRKEDTKWLYSKGGAGRFYPDLMEKRDEYLKENGVHPEDAVEFFLEKLKKGTKEEKRIVTSLVYNWEGNMLHHESNFHFNQPEDIKLQDVHSIKINMHYVKNDYFIEENQIMDNIKRIRDQKAIIIHGRFDVLCPVDQAYELHKALPNSILEIGNFDGHIFSKETFRLKKYMIENLISNLG